ncbi:YdeI family protein, partial [Streptomyces sp. NPDC058953]|uniref:YdeI/OmpD-associated family protein n=1 Tax=Streptomyces sp. NPDC058953 TaxID=3346676 RepID=UPI00367F26ED
MDQPRVFATADAYDQWLTEHHDTATEMWIALPKKGTDATSLTRAEALDVSLCHGWIDGLASSTNTPDGWWALRHSPRRPRSPWSKINRARAEELVREGRMRPAGLDRIESARADGRWAAAARPPRTAR